MSRFEALRGRLAESLDSRLLRAEEATIARQLAELDLQGVRALEREVERVMARVHKGEQEDRLLYERTVTLKNDLVRLERELHTATQEARAAADRASEATDEYPGAIARAQELLVERLGRPDLQREAQSAESTAQNFETRAGGELEAYREQTLTFNIRHTFTGEVRDPHDTRYAEERDRLSATALPTYQEQIAEERLKADDVLHNHVLHKLREKIHQARKTLDDLNYTLHRLPFRGEKYRFRTQPAGDPQLREIHDLIEGTQIVGKGSLFESAFYQTNKDTFDRFYESIIRAPTTDAERATQQRLMDYRRYLNYDIEVTHVDGQTSRLSRILGQTSGGETQTPFYLVIAASFVQLYRIQDRLKRPTIRLIAFDEAFDKMDQERISATLELFSRYGLQIIAAAPLERCEYLTPHVCTSLVLTAMPDRVLVDSYQNYAAQLVGTADGG